MGDVIRRGIMIIISASLILSGYKVQAQERECVIEVLAKMVWGEARGVTSDEQKLVIWTVFQRVDSGRYGETVFDVIRARNQFIGYNVSNPICSEIFDLCLQEYINWLAGDCPPMLYPYAPTLPYFYFSGRGGHNWFREHYRR